jgi:hypothetical protein
MLKMRSAQRKLAGAIMTGPLESGREPLAMTIRPILVLGLAGLALVSAPASARDGRVDGAAATLSDPHVQMAAAATLAAMVETILNMDITPFTRAIDAAGGGDAVRDLPPDAKLRDVAGPEAERMPRAIARNIPKAMESAAEMAGAVGDMMPQLKDTARRLKHAVPDY